MATNSATTRPRTTLSSSTSDFILNIAIAQKPGVGGANNLNWKAMGSLNREALSTTVSTMHNPPDPVQASVSHLLSRAMSLPCSTAAQAFSQLVQPTERFRVALDALLPLLEAKVASSPDTMSPFSASRSELPQRILVSYILYSLYTPHPIAINPFKSALLSAFFREREVAMTSNSSNEQLVWVLWKILKGDGNDISPYTPITLARSPLPPKLKASNLLLSEEEAHCDAEDDTATTPDINNSAEGNGVIGKDRPRPNSLSPSSSPRPKSIATGNELNDRIARGMSLIIAAKERVLTLSEQRFLLPVIPTLVSGTSSHNANGSNGIYMPSLGSMITSLDLAPLIVHNPTLAHPLIVALLTTPPPDLVKFSPELGNVNESLTIEAALPSSSSNITTASSVASFTTARSDLSPEISAVGMNSGAAEEAILSPTRFLDVLVMLPPILPAFDLVGRLLRDPTVIMVPGMIDHRQSELNGAKDRANNGNGAVDSFTPGDGTDDALKTTVADLVRSEYLGPFIHACIEYLNQAELEEREGRANEDRWGTGVRNLCRFYQSLIKLALVDPASDADSAEMARFTLQNARFEEAMSLYRVFANAKGGVASGL